MRSPECPKGVWPRSWASTIASVRSSFRRRARQMERAIWETSMVWVRRGREWSPSWFTKTWVLYSRRRKAAEWMTRSRSRWKTERNGSSGSGNFLPRDSPLLTAYDASRSASCRSNSFRSSMRFHRDAIFPRVFPTHRNLFLPGKVECSSPSFRSAQKTFPEDVAANGQITINPIPFKERGRNVSANEEATNMGEHASSRGPAGRQPLPVGGSRPLPPRRYAGRHQARDPHQKEEQDDRRGEHPPATSQIRLPGQESLRGE